jgi:hypothetical protein
MKDPAVIQKMRDAKLGKKQSPELVAKRALAIRASYAARREVA